jgi:hypothetical protein
MAMPAQLRKSYLSGKVAARIRWRTGGDYGRCVKQAVKHGMSPPVARGVCQKLHKAATGLYTGDKRHRRGRNSTAGAKIKASLRRG